MQTSAPLVPTSLEQLRWDRDMRDAFRFGDLRDADGCRDMIVLACNSDERILATFETMRQLRPHLNDKASYLALIKQMQHEERFNLYACYAHSACLGAMGFTIETRLVKGRIMYIADLVVDEAVRSRGIGKLLLAYAHHLAVNENCRTIYLDSGTHRLEAHNFYFREGFRITAFNFACDLPS